MVRSIYSHRFEIIVLDIYEYLSYIIVVFFKIDFPSLFANAIIIYIYIYIWILEKVGRFRGDFDVGCFCLFICYEGWLR